MMKKTFLMLSMVLAFAGCDNLGKIGSDSIPNPSPQQEVVAQQAYNAFREGKVEQLYTYFDPNLIIEFQQHEKKLMKFAKSIPKQNYTTKKIVSKHIENATSTKQSVYTVSYEYAYGKKNLVQYDVSFDQAGGSTKIQDFNVQVFGESTN